MQRKLPPLPSPRCLSTTTRCWVSRTDLFGNARRNIFWSFTTHVSANHLDIGVGTGYFLDKCTFPTPAPEITLVDLSPDSLEIAANRIARYHPKIYIADVLEPLVLSSANFNSIGINYVFHCLPGIITSKGTVFTHLKSLLKPEGVIFGATILGKEVPLGVLAKKFLQVYNRTGIFNNAQDSRTDLEHMLKTNFPHYTLHIIGCVAFFAGQI